MKKSRSEYCRKAMLAFLIALVGPNSVTRGVHILRIPMQIVHGHRFLQVRDETVQKKRDSSEPYDQLQRRHIIENNTSLFIPSTVNPRNFDYGSEGQSWSYQKRIRCHPEVPIHAKADILIQYDYAVETTKNSSMHAILQRLEYDMLMATVSELCGQRNIVGLYSSLPVDQPKGVCNPTEALAHYCTVLTGQMKISAESEKEAADIIDSVLFTVKKGCDRNIFVESASSQDLVKVRFMSPNPSAEAPITPLTATKAEVNKLRSVVPYAISGIVIGIVLFLLLFLTAWFIRKRQQRRQTAKETKSGLSEDSDDTEFEEPVYGNLGQQFPTQDVHRCMSMLCQQCRQLQQPTFLPTRLQQGNINDRDMESV